MNLKFLVDESTGSVVADFLARAGYDVIFVGDEMFQADDTKIIEFAWADQRIIVTNDKDFGDKVYRDGYPHAGIVLLRLDDDSKVTKLRVMKDLLDQYVDKLPNNFVVTTERQVRIRTFRNK